MKPTKLEAKKLALILTKDDLIQMFKNAQERHKDWHEVSTINLGLSKGTAYNILKHARPYANNAFNGGVFNAIREFGEYLPQHILDKIIREKKVKRTDITPCHQEPIFD
jgi:hypothetical protein